MTLPDVDRAIYSKLTGTAAITALVSTRIYERIAPAGVTRPYIVFYNASGLHPAQTPRDTFNYVYRVEAVVDDDSGSGRTAAFNLQDAIHSALSGASLSVTGWGVYWCDLERHITLIDAVEQGKQIRRLIGDYRIRGSKN